eukprot:CAMPEP_0176463776 /NCGR_PEP_ID=MMETSP0127-20121128/36100_1 /TAXON_ID=938130 /ORGANISM="Platyophrya macrostoma, Strain WH" /LENGTH=80 /DNA_ID=CAMNT_0017856021 /DNA_START=101 /DNA_END=340 /DNA_ORIENTATION=+
MIDIKYNTNNPLSRSAFNNAGLRNHQSSQDSAYMSSGYGRSSKGLNSDSNINMKANFANPIRVSEQFGDSEEDMDEQGNG